VLTGFAVGTAATRARAASVAAVSGSSCASSRGRAGTPASTRARAGAPAAAGFFRGATTITALARRVAGQRAVLAAHRPKHKQRE
jgi:hypothetical protein